MSSSLYLSRTIIGEGQAYSESELLSTGRYVVVLAEPGAGKTELMGSFARQLGTSVTTASKFKYSVTPFSGGPLVIDGFDELAKIDATGIFTLLAKAEAASPTHLYLSSRSSEWSLSATNAFLQFIGHAPLVVRLQEFNDKEQQQIFDHHVEGESFSLFQRQVERFDLQHLLPNPQFLKLLADAYIESDRQFQDKRSIFDLAVERLARETNGMMTKQAAAMPALEKVSRSSEVFAKLLLAGAEGISTSEASELRTYPLLATLTAPTGGANAILESRLFKPSDHADQHLPVHKIVSEYGAADYLAKRFANADDSLTLSRCLPIIAPNLTVRDELRGMLGWLASLGSEDVQRKAIELDPYAVLANGDPSQLSASSKRLLLERLKHIESEDPYFRRSDYWRRFSVAGFFTSEVISEVRLILSKGSGGHLRDLILELLAGSPAVGSLNGELRQILHDSAENGTTRELAGRCLLQHFGSQFIPEILELCNEASVESLRISAVFVEDVGVENVDLPTLTKFFSACSRLYPRRLHHDDHNVGSRYFVKRCISLLDVRTTEQLLDGLTRNLSCVCRKQGYECECLVGPSRVVGSLLDRRFALDPDIDDPGRVWRWLQNLRFSDQHGGTDRPSVNALQGDIKLRQSILALAFSGLIDRNQILNLRTDVFHGYGHAGLQMTDEDWRFVTDLAFQQRNPQLWGLFMVWHKRKNSSAHDQHSLHRRHMRLQANEDPAFMREWGRLQRGAADYGRQGLRLPRSHKRRSARHRRRREAIREKNLSYIQVNRELIEGGQHWGTLRRFAETALFKPGNLERDFGDESIARNALRNCLSFIAPSVPDLRELAELQCASKYLEVEQVLYAACFEIFRSSGSLEGIDQKLLLALRTNLDVHYDGIPNGTSKALKVEVDRLALPNPERATNFLREYLEPQLADAGCAHPQVGMLQSDVVFEHARPSLSLEWLGRFPNIAISALDTLFETAAKHGNRQELVALIEDRCRELDATDEAETDTNRRRREFWLIRALYFVPQTPASVMHSLASDQDTILLLADQSGRHFQGSATHWPRLTALKVELILRAYVNKWPKVRLPNRWGTGSPKGETAYRFLADVIWSIRTDDSDDAIPTLDRLLGEALFIDFHHDLRSIRAEHVRKRSLRNFEPPTPREVVDRLDRNQVVTVEGLRQLVLEELHFFQEAIYGGEFDTGNRFYEKGQHLNETACTLIVAERLSLRLQPQNIAVTPEHQLKNAKRSDFTVAKIIRGKRRLLVTEVKGQWHKDLYSAAKEQLHERYAIHPDAEQQGIYLALWFGSHEEVAGRRIHSIATAFQLKTSIETQLPSELKGFIDVFVLDVSKKPNNAN